MTDMWGAADRVRVRGFTLIETLIYIALFSLVVGGLIAAAYGLFETLATSQTRSMLLMETDFLLARIDQSLQSAKTINIVSSSEIVAIPWNPAYEPVTICASGGDLRLLEGAGSCSGDGDILNNHRARVSHLTFMRTPSDAGSYGGIEVGLVLIASTSQGRAVFVEASSTAYLRH